MSFDNLISLPLDELLDIFETFYFETQNEGENERVIWENGERIIERERMRR